VTASATSFRPEPGVPVVSMCNGEFWIVLKRLRRTKSNPTIWVPCMNWLSPKELRRYKQGFLPDAIVCQSEYQRSVLEPELAQYGLTDRVARIRGAFDASQVTFRGPRPSAGEFVIGRISRAAIEKFTPDVWRVLEAVRERIAPRRLRARVLGWRPLLAPKIGSPPDWVELYPPGSIDAAEFMQSLDVLYQSGRATENWPRVGLEAMAAGVPIVADDRGGWSEMLAGGLGHLVSSPEAAIETISRLAEDPPVTTTNAARRAVEGPLGNEGLWQQWQSIFERATHEWARRTETQVPVA
jgi:glycosyltransferase involved in cell wall biosynthesis